MIERSFAHCYETGRMRRVHLRGRENILKRQLIHVGAFNLSLIFRKTLGAGTPRELRNQQPRLIFVFLYLSVAVRSVENELRNDSRTHCQSKTARNWVRACRSRFQISGGLTTGC